MPTLEWIGKNKVVNHHQEVPFRVLERQYSSVSNCNTFLDNKSGAFCKAPLLLLPLSRK